MQINKCTLEISTIWSFPNRGCWGLHTPIYRGNFAPQIAYNVIIKYSKQGDTILDPMMGGGTTIVEANYLNRKGIGIDINPNAVRSVKIILDKDDKNLFEQDVSVGNVKSLSIKNNTIDLILTHPPYLNIIHYSNGIIPEDFSNISCVETFYNEFNIAVKELYRVLKPDGICAILIGDIRRHRHYIPLSHYIMDLFLKNNFILKDDIIKIQHNCQSTPYWKSKGWSNDFHLIMHEHLFIFRKPKLDEDLDNIRYSTKNKLLE